MLALIAGTGALPPALVARLSERPLICAMEGFPPDLPVDVLFRLEQLGSFLQGLSARGVTRICMAGAVRRPQIDPARLDAATMPLIPKLQAAMAQGDDGALRAIIALFEDAGFAVAAAHEIAPDLLPETGVLTIAPPEDWHKADAVEGEACVAAMGVADTGQACVVRAGQVVAKEGPDGTDAMLSRFFETYDTAIPDDPLTYIRQVDPGAAEAVSEWMSGLKDVPATSDGGILFKAPKPGQDRRADLPLIGRDTAIRAAKAGLSGIVIETGGVMVLDLPVVVDILDAKGMFLWVRPKGDA